MYNYELNIRTEYVEGFWEWFRINGITISDRLNVGDLSNDTNIRIGKCYRNSQIKCIDDDNLRYFEGFFVNHNNEVIPHGFNLTTDNRLVDFTVSKFPDNFRVAGNAAIADEYYGVNITTDQIDVDAIQHDTYNSSLSPAIGLNFQDRLRSDKRNPNSSLVNQNQTLPYPMASNA